MVTLAKNICQGQNNRANRSPASNKTGMSRHELSVSRFLPLPLANRDTEKKLAPFFFSKTEPYGELKVF